MARGGDDFPLTAKQKRGKGPRTRKQSIRLHKAQQAAAAAAHRPTKPIDGPRPQKKER